ncbi:DUF2130 domain-containing protein [Limnohabitans sp. 2KL-51]|uniref:DUF2130 domain-containing protein n=1 Tax=Limnohabitans sp. 2KL-51 TaxID=1977911 RepID=UPI000D38CA6D|nr:DUF2130 domain-containing protein [Limnohabitans sp. 2KL-51]PUE42293.1 hypothetical protein B9Z49_20850 [Limnohabitans sp. 2KL-51]
MTDIVCPHCHTAFKIDESGYAEILKQVHDKDFEKQLGERIKALETTNKLTTELAVSSAKADLERERDQLKAQLDKAQISQELALANAVAEITRERDRIQGDLDRVNLEKLRDETMLQQLHARELQVREEQIEHLRDMRLRLSTKMLGESLEQHCENEFNRIRPSAFPRAYFEKDNDTNSGTKGDYIFKDADESGTEIVSIMFEMKNESDGTDRRKKNEDFFKKLDKDRTDKSCEYAVLVSMLESDSDLYNTGIVDVSYKYPKMYVVRPQFFIPIITLLRNAAMNSLQYKTELALVKAQHIDITNFEAELDQFKSSFGRNYDLASRQFQTAMDEIDKSILHLQRTKDALLSTSNNLRLANNKAQDVSVKRLTRNNPTMAKKFDELRSTAAPADDSISMP